VGRCILEGGFEELSGEGQRGVLLQLWRQKLGISGRGSGFARGIGGLDFPLATVGVL